MYNEIKGDLFRDIHLPISETRIITHVVNDKLAWASGFVVPLGKNFPLAETWYKSWKDIRMGQNQYVPISDGRIHTYIVNMCAQTLSWQRPRVRDLRYNKLVKCMESVTNFIKLRLAKETCKIICPKFASGLAGGNWDFVRELIEDCWIKEGIDVTVYYL